jgi:hypothetical protein
VMRGNTPVVPMALQELYTPGPMQSGPYPVLPPHRPDES